MELKRYSLFILLVILLSDVNCLSLSTSKDTDGAAIDSSNSPAQENEKRVTPLLRAEVEPRIIGGTQAREGEFPYHVSIFKKDSAVFLCSGVILTEEYVLTTGWCANRTDASLMVVVAGNVRLSKNSPSVLRDVQTVSYHDKYIENTKEHDLAILKLKGKLDFTGTSINNITMRSSGVSPGMECTLTGWGSEVWNSRPSDVLMKLNLKTVSNNDCMGKVNGSFALGQICAGGVENENACNYDEGGPLVCAEQLTGVLSYSYNCGAADKPSVYADIASHKQWIDKVLNTGSTIKSVNIVVLLGLVTIFMFLRNVRLST